MKAFQSLLVGVFVTTSLYSTATPANAAAAAAPLIERSKLFGNPSRSGASLSPNGEWLSWLAPRDGVMNIGCAGGRSCSREAAHGFQRSTDSSVVLVAGQQHGDVRPR